MIYAQCAYAQICIDMVYVCDGINQCGDDSDESAAACASVSCAPNQYQCQIVRHCIPITEFCDGIKHCEFGDDENATCNLSDDTNFYL